MPRSRRWQPSLRASSVSLAILRGSFKYATFMGVVCFSLNRSESNGRLRARDRKWFKWFCLISRTLISGLYVKLYTDFIMTLTISHLKAIVYLRLLICIGCALFTSVVQFPCGDRLLDVVNRFFGLLQRVKAVRGGQTSLDYGGRCALGLLLVKVLGIVYEMCYLIPAVIMDFHFIYGLAVVADVYITANVSLLLYAYFVAYLTIGILYDSVNSYIRKELREQLEGLREGKVRRRQLRAAEYHLAECLAIYEEIHQVGASFERLFELPICIILIFGFLSIGSLAFFIILHEFGRASLVILSVKILTDILLLTLTIHIAHSNSWVIRRLSFENYYLSQDKAWHMRLEMFLSRLNYSVLRVQPLGLFEVSNKLVLVFLSGLLTYIIYIMQYEMKSSLLLAYNASAENY